MKDFMDHKGTIITITSGTIVRTIFFLIFFAFLYFIRDLVLVVLAAIVIASAVEPMTNWLARRHVKRLWAVVIIYLVLALLLAGFFVFFLPSLLNEAIVYLNNLPDTIHISDFWNPIRDFGALGQSTAIDSFSSQTISVHQFVDGLKAVISGSSEGIFKTASVVFGGALSFILMIVLSFYLAVQQDGISDFLKIITPISRHGYAISLWKRSQRKIGYWMQGQLLLGLIVGVLVYLGLMILQIPHPLLLASIAAAFELIPIFGPILSAIPAVIIASSSATDGGGFAKAVGVIILYLIIHQFENHLLYPLVVKKIVGVSPILVILALVIGVKLAGILGALLAVPVAAALMEYIGDIEKDKSLLNKPAQS